MVDINWNLLGRGPDIGQSFMTGLETGRAQRKQQLTQSALTAFAQNPNDPQAVNALMAVDPMMGLKVKEYQYSQQMEATKRQAEEQERQRKLLIQGAQIVRQFKPRDEATWQQARAAAAQMGIPLDQVPVNFDPNYVQQLINAADALEPEKVPGVAQERAYWASQGPEYAAAFDRKQLSQPDRYVPDGRGGVTIIPGQTFQPGAAAASPPAVLTDDDWGDVGGPKPQASGTFPR